MSRILFFLLLSVLVAPTAGCPQSRTDMVAASPTRAAPVRPAPSAAGPAYSLVPAPAPTPPAVPAWQAVAGKTVILDAGHGGHNLGASYFGLDEKDVNLALVDRTAAVLRSLGVNVLMTRRTDVFIPLPDRSAFANKNPDAVFVSVHCNASKGNPQARGVETYVLSREFSDDEQCRRALARYSIAGRNRGESDLRLDGLVRGCRVRSSGLAASVQRALAARLGEPDRGVKTANLAVLRETFFCPAILVEVGFISNNPTARKMAGSAWRDQTAQALADGIVAYLRQG